MEKYWSAKKVNFWWLAFAALIFSVVKVGGLLGLASEIIGILIFGVVILFLVIRKWH